MDHTLSLLSALNTFSPGTVTNAEIGTLKAVNNALSRQTSLVNSLATDLQNEGQPDPSNVKQLGLKSGEGNVAISKLISEYEAATIPAIKNTLEQISTAAETTATVLDQVPDRLSALGTLLEETMAAIEFGQSSLASLQQDLPAIREAVHTAASGVADKTQSFGTFVRDTLPLIQSSLPVAGEKIQQAANFVRQDLPAVEERVHQISDLIRTGLPVRIREWRSQRIWCEMIFRYWKIRFVKRQPPSVRSKMRWIWERLLSCSEGILRAKVNFWPIR